MYNVMQFLVDELNFQEKWYFFLLYELYVYVLKFFIGVNY